MEQSTVRRKEVVFPSVERIFPDSLCFPNNVE